MKKFIRISLSLLVVNICFVQHLLAQEKNQSSDKPVYAVVGGREGLTPFPNDEATKKIMRRNDIQDEGYDLAKKGFYEEAILKYKQALDPSLINHDYEKGTAIGAIVRIYQRQGKFEEALKEYQWFLDAYEKSSFSKDKSGRYANTTIDKKLELEALIKARDKGSYQPVYDHIQYLRKKYEKYIPPQSLDAHSFGMIPINDIIHIYDWIGDTDGGIKFADEVLSSKFLYPNERKEFERVKAAFEEDKRTGQKGRLQKVIETSTIIGW